MAAASVSLRINCVELTVTQSGGDGAQTYYVVNGFNLLSAHGMDGQPEKQAVSQTDEHSQRQKGKSFIPQFSAVGANFFFPSP